MPKYNLYSKAKGDYPFTIQVPPALVPCLDCVVKDAELVTLRAEIDRLRGQNSQRQKAYRERNRA